MINKIDKSEIICRIVLLIGIVFVCFPFYMMIVISLDPGTNNIIPFPPRLIPKVISGYNYLFILNDFHFLRYFFNTIMITAGAVISSVGSALLAGYAYSKMNFPFKKASFIFALSTIMIPSSILMIPNYMIIRRLGLYDTYWAFYLPALSYVFGAFFVKQFIDRLPDSIGESARMDGANEFAIFLKVYLPLCGPILATLVIFQFMGYYNDLYGALLYLKTRSKFNLPFAMAMYNSMNRQAFGVNFAMSVLSTFPIMVVFLIFQRYIVQSIAVTGIKQ